MRFDERLRTPWWWYLAALFIGALLAGEFGVADNALTVWIPFGVLLPGSVCRIHTTSCPRARAWSTSRLIRSAMSGALASRQLSRTRNDSWTSMTSSAVVTAPPCAPPRHGDSGEPVAGRNDPVTGGYAGSGARALCLGYDVEH